MKTSKDAINNSLDMADRIVGAYLGDLSDADLMVRPVPGMNHLAWQLGHLIAGEQAMMSIIDGAACPPLPPGFAERHSKETATVDDPAKFLKLEEYKQLWAAQRAATRKVLDAIPESKLGESDEKLPQYASTYGTLLNMQAIHPLMHVGQWVAVRRALGKPITI
jgi:hypothetical protein